MLDCRQEGTILIIYDAVFRMDGGPDARVVIRENRREAFHVDVERGDRLTVETWPAVGRGGVSLPELLSRYRFEFGPGYDLDEFIERA
jgi:hypothetical protein